LCENAVESGHATALLGVGIMLKSCRGRMFRSCCVLPSGD